MRPSRRRLVALLVFGFIVSTVAAARVARACFMVSPQPVQVWLDHITVDITDQVAVKTYNCTFLNPNPQAVVGGTCYMELEPGAQVDDMSVVVDGKEMKAEILDVEKAGQVFTELVQQGGSPALLEYYGNQLVQTQVPRIAPNGTVTVRLKYTTVLQKKGGLVRLQMLNTNPKALMQPLKSASVTVNINSQAPIKNVYSPTHKIKIVEKEDWDVAVEWSQDDYLPKEPFVLYYQTADEKLGASLLAHRELDEDGAFMLMLSPTIGNGEGQVSEADILPKDVVFCVDTSGSMLQAGKMEQARGALKYCVEHLRAGDRFNIVPFSTVARSFNEQGLVEFSDDTKAKALRYVAQLHARGGTAIQEALEQSLEHLKRPVAGDNEGAADHRASDGRLKMVLFATDGLPTIGERSPEAILKKIAKENDQDVRIFVFGEGFEVNTQLLDFLALDHRGEADYILPEEDIAEKISRFFDRVGSPIMTDLDVAFDGLQVEDVFPRHVADVYRGEQVIVYGRYTGHGEKTVRLSANVGGERKTFEYTLEFPEASEDDKSSFVPRLWAGKKVDFLLNEIRKSETENKELVDEVTFLAKRYGIVTPYTSFLVADDVVAEGREEQAQALRGAFGRFGQGGGGFRFGAAGGAPGPASASASTPALAGVPLAPAAADGAANRPAVDAARRLADLRRDTAASGGANAYYEFADEALAASGKKSRSSLSAIRYIGSRTFYKSGDVWYDSRFEPEQHKVEKTIKVGSTEYVALIRSQSRLAKYLALGDVVLLIDDTWHRFEG